MDKKILGSIIRKARYQKELTQKDLATKLNIPNQRICDWEHGRKEPTGIKVLEMLSELPNLLSLYNEKKQEIYNQRSEAPSQV